ncbi:short neuropeptide F precursor [Haemaphysalis longicornis]
MASSVVTAASHCLVLLLLLQATFASPDYKEIGDLYQLMLKGEDTGHALERKSDRAPSHRLRFGRRSDPGWIAQHAWSDQRAT